MWKPVSALRAAPVAARGGSRHRNFRSSGKIMEPANLDGMPADVLIVEDDPIIALGFEDTILDFGVKTVRVASSVAKALEMIVDRAPDFALLDIGLVREKSFAIAERLAALQIPFAFVTGYGGEGRVPEAFASRPRLAKPCSTDALEAVLKQHSGGQAKDGAV
jgi:CheY-like chemotaxis protein